MTSAAHLPLHGVRVIEMAQIMAGPTCGMMLADLGAEVIKIEKWPNGDDARQYQKPGDDAMPPSFRMINRGKRSLALDVRRPEGKAVLLRLIAQADIVTENFRVGVMERLGLGYDVMREANPSLIYCSITGWGRTGELAQAGGFDLVLQAFSGIIDATGEPGREPVKPGVSLADTNAGILAAMAILAAYIHRLKTGEGQQVGTSLLQAAMQQTYWLAANYFSSGRNTPRLGTAHSLIAPYQVFQAQDRRLVIAAGNPKAWAGMCNVLGHPEWQDDPRFRHPQQRVAHRAELQAAMEAVLAEDTASVWCDRLAAAGVPAGLVNTAGDALEHPQTRAVGMVIDVPDGQGGMARGIGSPLTLNGISHAACTPAPGVGEHSVDILRRHGLTSVEIETLLQQQVVWQG